jgi:hypothetical protein
LKRKLVILRSIEGFFELHSRATERRKGKKRVQGGAFKNNPVGYFSERASWRKAFFSQL